MTNDHLNVAEKELLWEIEQAKVTAKYYKHKYDKERHKAKKRSEQYWNLIKDLLLLHSFVNTNKMTQKEWEVWEKWDIEFHPERYDND